MNKLIIFLLSVQVAVGATVSTNVYGVKLSGWTTTTNPTTAKAALGVTNLWPLLTNYIVAGSNISIVETGKLVINATCEGGTNAPVDECGTNVSITGVSPSSFMEDSTGADEIYFTVTGCNMGTNSWVAVGDNLVSMHHQTISSSEILCVWLGSIPAGVWNLYVTNGAGVNLVLTNAITVIPVAASVADYVRTNDNTFTGTNVFELPIIGSGYLLTNIPGDSVVSSVANADVANWAVQLIDDATNLTVLAVYNNTNLSASDGIRFVGNGSGLTNVAAATAVNAIGAGNIVTNGHTAAITVTSDFTSGTNRATKVRVGGAAETADALGVTGTAKVSGAIEAEAFNDSNGSISINNAVIMGSGSSVKFGSTASYSSTADTFIERGGVGTVSIRTNLLVGSVTVTNKFITPTNSPTIGQVLTATGTNGQSAWVGPSFASIMMYTTNTINGGAGTYAVVTNYTTGRSNIMGCNLASGVITNLVTGFYRVGIHLSGKALDNAATVEGDLLLNGVEKDEVSFIDTYSTPAATRDMSAIGILYITNNTELTFQIKSSGANGVEVYRAQMVVGAP